MSKNILTAHLATAFFVYPVLVSLGLLFTSGFGKLRVFAVVSELPFLVIALAVVWSAALSVEKQEASKSRVGKPDPRITARPVPDAPYTTQ